MRDNLPKKTWKNEMGVVNLDDSNGPGTHWVAYCKKLNTVLYFDSFGNLQPPIEINKYLGSNIYYNYKKCQNFNSFMCGHLCLKFLMKHCNK